MDSKLKWSSIFFKEELYVWESEKYDDNFGGIYSVKKEWYIAM